MVRLRTIGVVAIISFLLSAPTALGGTPTTATTAAVSDGEVDPDLDRQIEFRRQFGLDASVTHVRSSQALEKSEAWGIPLTAGEEQEMARRGRVSDGLGPLQKAVESETGFSGIYIDQAAGGIIHIRALPASRKRMQQLAAQLAPADSTVFVDDAMYSDAELQDLRLQIQSLMVSRAVDISTLTVDVIANRVAVGLNPPTFDADRTQLKGMFPGAPLTIFAEPHGTPAACTQDACWPPSRGGITLSTSFVCTSTFNAKNGAGNVFLVTAGHCANENVPGTINVSFFHNGVNRGKNTVNAWKGASSFADATIVDISNAAVSNLIYVTSAVQRAMTSKKALNAGVVGDPICANGVVTDFFCGVIKDVDIDVNNGVPLLHQRLASIDIAQGDSGATVFYGTTIHGLVNTVAGAVIKPVPKTWADLYYTQVRDVELQLNVNAVLN
jgi:hypothetical protein